MRERQLALVMVSKQYRQHAFCKRRPRLRTRVNQSPLRPRAEVSFPRARQFSEYNGKEASASRVCLKSHVPKNRNRLLYCQTHSVIRRGTVLEKIMWRQRFVASRNAGTRVQQYSLQRWTGVTVLGVAWCSTHQSTLVALKATPTSDNGKERTISLKGTVSNLQKKLDDLHSHLSNSEDYRRWFLYEFTSRGNPATKETLQYCCHKPMLRNSFGWLV